jgi:putative lipase involved disintegration of autophagic bodies
VGAGTNGLQIFVTGHSLGGALATLSAYHLYLDIAKLGISPAPEVSS